MAPVVDSIVQPDEAAINAHLDTLFSPLREEYPGGIVELRYGERFASAYFNLQPQGMADAATFAAGRNREGQNVYVGVNPRKPSIDTKRAATDADVEIAIWQFADIDALAALEGLGKRLRALSPTYSVDTGTRPHRRPHLYWRLEEPVWNMSAWTERQRGIAQAVQGDAVINPSRIMRLAGTVNFPPQHKLQRGYAVETTTLKTVFNGDEDRGPYAPEQVAAAYPVATAANSAVVQPGQTTLSAMRRTRVGDLLDACCSGNQWHNNMIRMVGHLASTGRTSAEIMALAEHITLPGYTADQTRREMQSALNTARLKWALPEPEDDVATEEHARDEGDSVFELLDLEAIELIPPPSYLIEDVLPDDGLSIMYGDPGAGKSFIALDMSLRLATAMDWHGIEAKPTGVLYIAGEAQKGVANRIKGWRRQHDLLGVHAPFVLLPVAVQLLDPKQRQKLLRSIDAAIRMAGFHIGLIVVDTVSRALAGADENGQESMSAFVSACDEIKRHVGGALLGVHHTGKDKEKGMRGSSVLLGGCDASFKITKDDENIVTIDNEKQKDAEETANTYLKLSQFEWVNKGFEKPLTTLVPFRSEAPTRIVDILSNEQIAIAFGMIADAWTSGKPLSTSPNTREQGRYAPSVLANRIGCAESVIKSFLVSWLETSCLSIEEVNAHSKTRGLRVLNPIVKGG